MRRLYLYVSFLIVPLWVNGQIVLQPKTVDYNTKGVIYSSEQVYEVRAHMHGFAIGYKRGRLRNYYETTYMAYELGYMVDARQKKFNKMEARIANISRKSFYYGKRSNVINMRVSYGKKTYLSEKTKRKGVAMGYIYEGGASLALIKPNYIKVVRVDEDLVARDVETIRYSEETREDFLDFEKIYGGTSYAKGLTEITPTIGLHGKIGLHWALGAYDQRVKAVEVGLMMDLYPRKLPLIVEREDISNDFVFLKLYAAFQFGKRAL